MIAVGDDAPELVRTVTLLDMVAYAGATWDWHPLHYDTDYLAAKGLQRPVVDGQLFGALLVEQLQDWLGPRAFVRRLRFRFAGLVFAGETVRCTARVTAVDDGVAELACRVDVVGTDPRAAISSAAAEVRLP